MKSEEGLNSATAISVMVLIAITIILVVGK